MKFSTIFQAAAAVVFLGAGTVYAQSAGAFGGAFSKAFLIPTVVCQAGDTSLGNTGALTCGPNTTPAPGLLAANVKMPSGNSGKALLLMASLEDAITTDTNVASGGSGGNGGKQTSSAMGSVVVSPSIVTCGDANCTTTSACTDLSGNNCNTDIFPSVVTFAKQEQTLSANLLGLGCTANTTTGAITCTSPETIELILSLTSADSFNFIVNNLPEGTYQVRLNVMVTTAASTTSLPGGATVDVAVGAGSLGALVVQAQTPFNTITTCSGGGTGTTNPCTP